jgi:hypothetical protein
MSFNNVIRNQYLRSNRPVETVGAIILADLSKSTWCHTELILFCRIAAIWAPCETTRCNYTWVLFKEHFSNTHKFEHNPLPVPQPIGNIDICNRENTQRNMNQWEDSYIYVLILREGSNLSTRPALSIWSAPLPACQSTASNRYGDAGASQL